MTKTAAPTLVDVPVKDLKPDPNQPRKSFDADALDALAASIKEIGLQQPIRARKNGTGYIITSGERRYRAAKIAKLTTVPVIVADDGEKLTAAQAAENIARADLTPVEEAHAAKALVEEHGSVETVSRMVGKSVEWVEGRIALLDLSDEVLAKLDDGSIPLHTADVLRTIHQQDAYLARAVAALLAQDPANVATFRHFPGEVVEDALEVEWRDVPDGMQLPDDEKKRSAAIAKCPLLPIHTLASGWNGMVGPRNVEDDKIILRALGSHGKAVTEAWKRVDAVAPSKPKGGDYSTEGYAYREYESERARALLTWDEDDVDAARAYGCLLSLAHDRRDTLDAITDPQWAADRLVQKADTFVKARERKAASDAKKKPASSSPGGGQTDKQKQEAAAKREADRKASERARNANVALGVKLAKWQPKAQADVLTGVKALAYATVIEYGEPLAWSDRLTVDGLPVKTYKDGRFKSVEYPRTPQQKRELTDELLARIDRAKTVEEVVAVVMRPAIAAQNVKKDGLPGADTGGVYDPFRVSQYGETNTARKKAQSLVAALAKKALGK